jgi:hypothetical protein
VEARSLHSAVTAFEKKNPGKVILAAVDAECLPQPSGTKAGLTVVFLQNPNFFPT